MTITRWLPSLGLGLLAMVACPAAMAAPPPAAQPPATPAPAAQVTAKAPAESCAGCHVEAGDERLEKPAKMYPNDIHAAKGFGCVACHGGDSRATGMEAMDPRKGYIGKPKGRQIIQVCGRCHSDPQFMKQYNPALRVDQVAEYETSVHGRRLKEQSDPKVATCASCHPAHSIQPPSDPRSSVHPLKVAETCGHCHADAKYMASYKIPTDQLEKFKASVHWNAMSVKGDLSAPTCNKCHGNHGAAPPGVNWVGNVCGQCHAVQGELFAKSVHARVFTQMGVPGCATCHENHRIKKPSDELVGLDQASACSACHNPGDKGGQSAVEMRKAIDSLRGDYDRARATLLQAEHAGMEVSQAQFDLNAANDALVKARAAVHTFTVDAVKKEITAGLAVSEKAQSRGVRALNELKFRRKGLVISLVIVLFVIAGLMLKIRQIERAQSLRHTGRYPGGA